MTPAFLQRRFGLRICMAGPVSSVLVFPGLAAYATEAYFSFSW